MIYTFLYYLSNIYIDIIELMIMKIYIKFCIGTVEKIISNFWSVMYMHTSRKECIDICGCA